VCDSHDRGRLYQALAQLAEQDPLINVRQDDARAEISVSLYGEVQQEVIQATLASDYGIAVGFREATTIYIERPLGSGETVEVLHAKTKSNVTGKSSPNSSNPFLATLGLRVDPAPAGTGVEFRLEVEVRLLPIYIYKTIGNLINHMQQYIRETLQEGLSGWKVTDCTVTMTDCGYRAPGTTAADFRRLTPLVLMQALKQSQTVPCEPMLHVRLELPTTAVGTVGAELGRLGLALETTSISHDRLIIETVMPAAHAQHLQRQLPALTGGEGALDSTFAGYRPVTNIRPTRPRTTPNPLNLDEYLMHLPGRAKGGI
jgi:ribosomal protection tetracycline resistance protein